MRLSFVDDLPLRDAGDIAAGMRHCDPFGRLILSYFFS